MNKTKKILSLLLSFFLVSSILVSCIYNNNADDSTTTSTETEEADSNKVDDSTATSTETEEVDSTDVVSDSYDEDTDSDVANVEIGDVCGTYARQSDNPLRDWDWFTITLNADGTYTYYETNFSSHIGSGEYTLDGNIITITDAHIPTLSGTASFVFKFKYRNGKLIFLAAESDRFIYVDLPDGAEFNRVQPEE